MMNISVLSQRMRAAPVLPVQSQGEKLTKVTLF